MKITFLIRALSMGGAERQLVNLAIQLSRRAHRVQILTFYPEGVLEAQLQGTTVRCVSLKKQGRWDVFGFLVRLVAYLRKNKPDILHSYLPTSNLLAACLKPVIPGLKIIYGLRASYLDYTRYDTLARLISFLEAKAFRFADCLIFNSNAGYRDALRRGFNSVRHAIIFNGIDTDEFRFDLEKRKALRARLGLGAEEYLVGIVGRLDPMKGHEEFFKLAFLLAQWSPQVFFVCVGQGPEGYKKYLHTLALEYGIAAHLFWLECEGNVSEIYSALDLLCLTSLGESFPNVLGEAMACGTPCVATDVGDVKEILGSLGSVVPLQDTRALFHEAVQHLENRDTLDRMALRKRVEERFTLKKMTDETERVLNEIMGKELE